MGYFGIHRKAAKPKDATYASSPPEHPISRLRGIRPRRSQPRDSQGRFRKAGMDDEFAVRPVGDTPAVPEPERTGRRWRELELDDDLPRTFARAPDWRGTGPQDGRRHCGPLEHILFRQWDAAEVLPTADVVRAVDSLAELPDPLKEILAGGLGGIYVGMGGVPDLDDMGFLKGKPLPSGKATWDVCAGAYGDRKIVVGDRPSPTPDVMMHEVGHALDDIDGGKVGDWQSDSPDFRALYEQCRPNLASEFHLQGDDLGRREFFADAFAAIASRQRPALIDMLGGDIRTALDVMLFFNRRYGV